ncbi:tektin-4-like [Watersipora subatra]|uniref:tektin-4-like n=1 Tax=Watersipora subatra TaxID=2589382 RepID=UPI00355B5283
MATETMFSGSIGPGSTLMTREMPPERPTPQTQGSVVLEQVYQGNTGNDMGISTVGYRSAKYNPSEWHESNYAKYYQAFVDRDNAERIRHESLRTEKETEATTNKVQNDVTKALGERLHDIHFWKSELEREVNDMIGETDLLLAQKKRLDHALLATEIPMHIATDNLNCRARRQGIDLVQDEVELSLLKEVEIINNVQDLLRKTIKEAEKQIKLNRDAKQNLEMDWSDKKEAHEIDTACFNLRNGHTNKQFHPGVARYQEIQSTPESWAQFSHDNIVAAENERMASIQLRTLIDNVLNDTSRDMMEQCDVVDTSFAKRVEELEDAKAKMEENLKKVCDDISRQERNIADLKKAIRDKEDPMKVAQTRLYNRESRPGVELCRDEVQKKLIDEVAEIQKSIDALVAQLQDAEASLKQLQDDRMTLEKEIAIKKNSIFIDKNKCMTHRTRYPTTLKLQGYNQ